MSRLSRENFVLSGFICIVAGAFLSVGGLGAMALTIGLSGVVLYLMGMFMSRQTGLSPQAVAEWAPEAETLPDAGRFMFRVDVTLDEPIRTSVLCGPCSHVEVRDGPKPSAFTCPNCERLLWDEEE